MTVKRRTMDTVKTFQELGTASVDDWEDIPEDQARKAIAILKQGGSVSRLNFPSESSEQPFTVVFGSKEGREEVQLTSKRSLCPLGPGNLDTQWWLSHLHWRFNAQD